MNYHLTTMTAEHIPQIAQLERACFSHPWSEELLAQELWNDASAVIVAEGEDGTVLGYAGVSTVLDEGYINNVAVASQFRRQGVADELIAALVRFGRAKPSSLWRSAPPTPPPSPCTPSTASGRRGGGRATMTIPKRMRS